MQATITLCTYEKDLEGIVSDIGEMNVNAYCYKTCRVIQRELEEKGIYTHVRARGLFNEIKFVDRAGNTMAIHAMS